MLFYKLLDWINENKLDIKNLNLNSKAINYLIENPKKINWYEISHNKNAYDILVNHQKNIVVLL